MLIVGGGVLQCGSDSSVEGSGVELSWDEAFDTGWVFLSLGLALGGFLAPFVQRVVDEVLGRFLLALVGKKRVCSFFCRAVRLFDGVKEGD